MDAGDALAGLKIVAGVDDDVSLYDWVDVNGDERIGIEEVIDALWKISDASE